MWITCAAPVSLPPAAAARPPRPRCRPACRRTPRHAHQRRSLSEMREKSRLMGGRVRDGGQSETSRLRPPGEPAGRRASTIAVLMTSTATRAERRDLAAARGAMTEAARSLLSVGADLRSVGYVSGRRDALTKHSGGTSGRERLLSSGPPPEGVAEGSRRLQMLLFQARYERCRRHRRPHAPDGAAANALAAASAAAGPSLLQARLPLATRAGL